jgi:hypothetical protein
MKPVRCIYDEKPQRLLKQDGVVFRLPAADHKRDVNAGHATLIATHFRLFPSFLFRCMSAQPSYSTD